MKVAAFVTSDIVAQAVFQHGLQLHPLDGIQALHRLKQLLCLSPLDSGLNLSDVAVASVYTNLRRVHLKVSVSGSKF